MAIDRFTNRQKLEADTTMALCTCRSADSCNPGPFLKADKRSFATVHGTDGKLADVHVVICQTYAKVPELSAGAGGKQ